MEKINHTFVFKHPTKGYAVIDRKINGYNVKMELAKVFFVESIFSATKFKKTSTVPNHIKDKYDLEPVGVTFTTTAEIHNGH